MRLTAYASIAFTALVASGSAIKLENEGFPLPFGVKNMLGIEHNNADKIDDDKAGAADDVSASTVAAKTTTKGTKVKPTKLVATDEAIGADEVTEITDGLKTKAAKDRANAARDKADQARAKKEAHEYILKHFPHLA